MGKTRTGMNAAAERMMDAVEHNYKIQVAAVKVFAAEEVRKAAAEAHRHTTYDVHKPFGDEGNRRFIETADAEDKADRDVKKAVKRFFELCGKDLPKDWRGMTGMQAYWEFGKYVKDFSFYHTERSPLDKFSIVSCC